MTNIHKLHILWAITRMRRLFTIWDRGLDQFDKEYCLRRIRDREPTIFWKIAQEHLRQEIRRQA